MKHQGDGIKIAFCNKFDEGYHVNLPAWRAGRQHVSQPIFEHSNENLLEDKQSKAQTLHQTLHEMGRQSTTVKGQSLSKETCKRQGSHGSWIMHG